MRVTQVRSIVTFRTHYLLITITSLVQENTELLCRLSQTAGDSMEYINQLVSINEHIQAALP